MLGALNAGQRKFSDFLLLRLEVTSQPLRPVLNDDSLFELSCEKEEEQKKEEEVGQSKYLSAAALFLFLHRSANYLLSWVAKNTFVLKIAD